MRNINEMGGKKYPLLFKPLKVGKINIPNRIFFPPFDLNWANKDGTLTKKLFDLYISLADNGCGIIYTGAATVSRDSIPFVDTMRLFEKKQVDDYKKLSKEIENRGVIPAIQLFNAGLQSITFFTNKAVYGPSAIPNKLMKNADPAYEAKEMTLEDIARVKQEFISGAVMAAEAGFKIVQLHATHGYLLCQFLSPSTNKRTDNYGGNLENRARFIVEIIEGIKKELGSQIAIDLRVSGDELLKNDGTKLEHYKTYIPMFEKAGIDMINVSMGTFETLIPIYNQGLKTKAPYAYAAKKINEYSNVPVGHAGWIDTLETGEESLKKGDMDLIGYGRALFAENELIKKTVEGRIKDIVKCTWCGKCLYDLMDVNYLKSYCSVNEKYKRPKISAFKKRINKIIFFILGIILRIKKAFR